MRQINILIDDFENIQTLQQFLYMSEEHNIVIHNAIGVPLRIRMDENLNYWCKNLNFPDIPESNWNNDMTLKRVLNIIAALKDEPAIMFPEKFENRWLEIKSICEMNIALNKTYRRDRRH